MSDNIPYIDKDDILEQTDGGLDVFSAYYPDAAKCKDKKNYHFKQRVGEKTASATCTLFDNKWYLKDFGSSEKGKDAIQFVKDHENKDFHEALLHIAKICNLTIKDDGGNSKTFKAANPDYEKETEGIDESIGYYYKKKEGFTDAELVCFGRRYKDKQGNLCYHVSETHLKELGYSAISEYSVVKEDNQGNKIKHIYKSNESFPMFVLEDRKEEIKKLYKPKEQEKKYRFLNIGKFPEHWLWGMTQLKERLEAVRSGEVESGSDGDRDIESRIITGGHTATKFKQVIIASGGSDAANVLCAGYPVLFPNGEGFNMTPKLYDALSDLAHEIFICFDIDDTGIKEAHKICLEYWDIKMIELPKSLKGSKDSRYRKPMKDVKDFFKITYDPKREFKRLVMEAKCLKPYDIRYNSKTYSNNYSLVNTNIYDLLRATGFGRIKDKTEKKQYSFVRVTNKREVERIDEPSDIKTHLIDGIIKPKKLPLTENKKAVLEMMYRTRQLSASSFENLSFFNLDFKTYDRDHQLFYFKNAIIKVDKNGIQQLDHVPGKFVWEHNVIPFEIPTVRDKNGKTFFETAPFIVENVEGNYMVQYHDENCHYLRYLRDTSLVHWKKEEIHKQELTVAEQLEQHQHWANKLYTVGYNVHQYKDKGRPWITLAFDNNNLLGFGSEGGSGKSIYFDLLSPIRKVYIIDAKEKNLLENTHWSENVSASTDLIVFDDIHKQFNEKRLYSMATGNMTINPKGVKSFQLQFEESPKIAITLNHMIDFGQGSTKRRSHFIGMSDYYHSNSNREYKSERKVDDVAGKLICGDQYTHDEWMQYYRTVIYCCHTYFKHNRIDPPTGNLNKIRLKNMMKMDFFDWAEDYLANHLNEKLPLPELTNEFFGNVVTYRPPNPNRYLKEKLNHWCDYHGYELNPDWVTNGKRPQTFFNGRCILTKKYDFTADYVYIYDKTKKGE